MSKEELQFSRSVNSDTFYNSIVNLVETHDLPYMDAVILYCENNGVEIETAAALIKGNARLKAQIQVEGEGLNFLEKVSRLEV